MSHLALLHVCFAAVEPTWTDKEMLVAVGSTLATIASFWGACWWVMKRYLPAEKADAALAELVADKQGLQKERAELQARVELLETEADTLRQKRVKAEEYGLRSQVIAQNAVKEVERQSQVTGLVSEEAERLKAELSDTADKLEEHQVELASVQRLIKRATQKGGQSWNEKVRANTPKFDRLDADGRRTPIISVLNLKGGVGKTTIAANLGAAFDDLGYRVLLIDLDLQGSLTGLFLPEGVQKKLWDEEKLLENFLNARLDAESPNILDYTQEIPGRKSALVPTSDTLAYAETNLTLRWMLHETNRDPRFLLRKELHLKHVTNAFNVILMDCPPILNMCCVNAMAASDYLLIPIVPSKQATARVPLLLKRLRELRDNVNRDLKVIGVVTNLTARSELTVDETNRLTALGDMCRNVWGTDVPLLDTFIRRGKEVREAEDEYRTLLPTDSTYQHFLELAREIESGVPSYCRVDAAVRPGQEVTS